MIVISRDDYIRNAKEPIDHGRLAYPHGCSNAEAARNQKYLDDWCERNHKAALEAGAEWDRMFAAGEVREPTREENWIRTANSDFDNECRAAARRVCEKRGIDWRKGL